MESFFGPVPFNTVNFDNWIYSENWPPLIITSDVNFTETPPCSVCLV